MLFFDLRVLANNNFKMNQQCSLENKRAKIIFGCLWLLARAEQVGWRHPTLKRLKEDQDTACSSSLGCEKEGAARLLSVAQRRMGGSAQGIPVSVRKNIFLWEWSSIEKLSGQEVGCPPLKLHKTEHGSEQPVFYKDFTGQRSFWCPFKLVWFHVSMVKGY